MTERRTKQQSIGWFIDQQQFKKLDLNPDYQRGGEVWSQEYKNYFIDTILRNFPAPAIFLHVDTGADGRTIYHVVDGKQRLTTIFEFIIDGFPIGKPKKYYNPPPDLVGKVFSEFPDQVRKLFYEYEMPIQEVLNAPRDELIEAFYRLNRNVAKLTKQELRHAKYDGTFITLIENLADDPFWEEFGLFGKAKARRMADVEFISEIFLLTMHGVLDGSDTTLDNYYADYDDEIPDEEEHRKKYESCKQMFNELGSDAIKTTRFKNLGDFYGLWATFLKLLDVSKKPSYKKIRQRLKDFSNLLEMLPISTEPTSAPSPEKLEEFQGLLEKLPIDEEQVARYYDAVRQGTNKLANRLIRAEILETVIRK